jgi:hypothetical protein
MTALGSNPENCAASVARSGIGAQVHHSAQQTKSGAHGVSAGPAGDADVPPNGAPGGLPSRLLRRGGDPGVAKGRDHVLGKPVEVCQLDVERGAERGGANNPVETGIALLDRL